MADTLLLIFAGLASFWIWIGAMVLGAMYTEIKRFVEHMLTENLSLEFTRDGEIYRGRGKVEKVWPREPSSEDERAVGQWMRENRE